MCVSQGTYAVVHKGYSLVSASMVALKEIRMHTDEGAPCTALREISLLRGLRHANIITLHDVIFVDQSLTLVFEYGVSCRGDGVVERRYFIIIAYRNGGLLSLVVDFCV